MSSLKVGTNSVFSVVTKSDTMLTFVVFVAVTDEDIILKTWQERWHNQIYHKKKCLPAIEIG